MIDVAVAQRQGARQEQQDRAVFIAHPREPGVLLAVVADGMGGHSGGALAAQQLVHTCASNFERYSPRCETPQDLLAASLAEAHLLIKASRFINEKEPHSTAVVLLVQPGQAYWAHCGDSRLYRLRGERVVARTTDHSYVEQLVSAYQITPQQALVDPRRNVLTTALGGECSPRIAFGEAAELRGGDAFVLCSDGLWTCIGNAELAAVVAAHGARDACAILINRAGARAGEHADNATVLVVKLSAAPGWPARRGTASR